MTSKFFESVPSHERSSVLLVVTKPSDRIGGYNYTESLATWRAQGGVSGLGRAR
jgi:hypothetical protein